MYNNNNLEEVNSYKYLRLDHITRLIGTIAFIKGLIESANCILFLKQL